MSSPGTQERHHWSEGARGYQIDRKKRLVSLDGGGIYGLTQAIWLKELCKKAPSFLNETDVDYYFVGCSAGGMNALILAHQEDPRDFIMKDGLQEFWYQSGIYTNYRNPVDALLSNFGLASWLGSQDYLDCCNRHFGDVTLGQLPHKVVITTFNWSGERPAEDFDSPGDNDPQGSPASHDTEWYLNFILPYIRQSHLWRCFWPVDDDDGEGAGQVSFFEAWLRSLGFNGVRKGSHTHAWFPMPFCNFNHMGFPHSSGKNKKVLNECNYRAADVFYGVAAMPAIRAIRGGIGDAGVYSANPASGGIAAVVQEAIAGDFNAKKNVDEDAANDYLHCSATAGDNSPYTSGIRALKQTRMLSVGGGGLQPSFSFPNHNFGVLPWMLLKVNPAKAGLWKNADYNLNHVVLDVTVSAEALLHPHFHRMNPSVNPDPAGPLVLKIRNPFWRELIIQQVENAARSKKSLKAVDKAARFIEPVHGEPWTEGRDSREEQKPHNFSVWDT